MTSEFDWVRLPRHVSVSCSTACQAPQTSLEMAFIMPLSFSFMSLLAPAPGRSSEDTNSVIEAHVLQILRSFFSSATLFSRYLRLIRTCFHIQGNSPGGIYTVGALDDACSCITNRPAPIMTIRLSLRVRHNNLEGCPPIVLIHTRSSHVGKFFTPFVPTAMLLNSRWRSSERTPEVALGPGR